MKYPATTFILATVQAAYMAINDVRCTQNDHWVGILPYFRSDQIMPCSYAGTLISNDEATHHLFYWMYPTEDENAPVTVWLNGGPGASSTFANFLLNGPLEITHNSSSPSDYDVHLKAEGSWTDISNMVFVDQPVGTGFSWGVPLLTNEEESSQEFLNFMDLLYLKYPEFEGRDLYLTGESYGGKYLPRYSYELLMENQK